MSPSEAEERRQVADQIDAGDPPQRRQQRRGAAAEDAHSQPGGTDERLHRPPLEKRGKPPRGLEEVERVARRWGVEDEQVEVALAGEVVELGHRGELLRARDGVGELAIDAVGLDLLGALGGGGDPLDQLVERPLGVEHHRPQLALEARSRLRPAGPASRGSARSGAPRDRAHWPAGGRGRSSRPPPSPRARPSPGRSPPSVVVLPTPPAPPQTQTRLPSSSAATLTRPPLPTR